MTADEIVTTLLTNRGLTTPKLRENFFNPVPPADLPLPFAVKPAQDLIQKHVNLGHKIAIYGDYDVDGICATAIMWETLYSSYKQVFPHIPHRESEGYGLTTKGIDHCLAQGAKLIIAVDNGIVAFEQIDYCRSLGGDIIVIDHHEPQDRLPQPTVLLHSTSSCAAGLTWLLCRQLAGVNSPAHTERLSLAAIATICDLVPLLDANRSFAKHGLVELNRTRRPGLLALLDIARLQPGRLGAYQVGFVIGPRLNSMGRLEHAIDSLRLLCTPQPTRARELAQILDATNKLRQSATDLSVNHALSKFKQTDLPAIILSADASYHQGIIGLIAAKLVENYWRPSIAVSIGEEESRGSARSVPGFHITDFLRSHQDLFTALGGHASAGGFTIKTSRIGDLAHALSQAKVDPDLLIRKPRIDLAISLSQVSDELYRRLGQLEPHGLGNPLPVFASQNVTLADCHTVGRTNQHLKCQVDGLSAIAFNRPTLPTSPVDITYSLDQNIWNGNSRLQLVIKDLRPARLQIKP